MNLKTKTAIVFLLLAVLAALAFPAKAADFSPTIKFSLSSKKVKANPSMNIHVEQEDNEEELKHVTLALPAGFKLPTDAKIPDGDGLGSGEIVIHAGPGCSSGVPADAPITAPATLEERDRTDDEVDSGVRAVWVLDISGVTKIELAHTGSPFLGIKLDGDIPANANTCPPFEFDLTVQDKSDSGVPILRNPRVPKRYVFKAEFLSQDSPAIARLRQAIRIRR